MIGLKKDTGVDGPPKYSEIWEGIKDKYDVIGISIMDWLMDYGYDNWKNMKF